MRFIFLFCPFSSVFSGFENGLKVKSDGGVLLEIRRFFQANEFFRKKIMNAYYILGSCFPHRILICLFSYFFLGTGAKRALRKADKVFLANTPMAFTAIKWLRRNKPELVPYIVLWNPVKVDHPIHIFRGLNVKFLSFDLEDCRRFEMGRISLFVNSNEIQESLKRIANTFSIKHYNVAIVADAKDRLDTIRMVCSKLRGIGFTVNEYVTYSNSAFPRDPNYLYKPCLSKSMYFDMSFGCDVMLEVLQRNQSESTLRPLEALFANKKLITTNPSIRFEPYYSPERFFVWGEDFDLHSFISNPVQPVNEEILYDYSIRGFADCLLKASL